MTDYSAHFYRRHREGARRSARRVVPLVLEMFRPQSVVDVGCGTGAWLSVFREQGVKDVLGIDGPHLDPDLLDIRPDDFLARDLTDPPLEVGRRFDLALSLEVGEHLPAKCAAGFVASLVDLAPVVVFSAAIPGQGGTDHRNESWPRFWADLFSAEGYTAVDALRPRIWEDEAVEWWYRQNLLVFVDAERLESLSPPASGATAGGARALVHPELFTELHRAVERCRAERWAFGRGLLARRVRELSPPGAKIIVVDQNRLCVEPGEERRVSAFPSEAGRYRGPPSDSRTALRALESASGPEGALFVLPWSASWWLEAYPELFAHLEASARRVADEDVLSAWELPAGGGRPGREGDAARSGRTEGARDP